MNGALRDESAGAKLVGGGEQYVGAVCGAKSCGHSSMLSMVLEENARFCKSSALV
jgi:hypothetical protein